MPLPNISSRFGKVRILSIDMGIKNLAFCVADVQMHTHPEKTSDAFIHMDIQAWRRLDAVEEVTATSPERDEWSTPPASDDEEAVDPYAPSSLSQTAFHLITQTFLPYKPDVVLIETQRWRSGGGPAIQQWTVRVNTLEGMLWALFTAFQTRPSQLSSSVRSKTELKKSYEIWGVDPRRVGAYWVGQEVKEEVSTKGKKSPRTKPASEDEVEFGPEITEFQRTVKKSSRGKVEKKAKIDALRSWLRREPPATAPSVEPLAKGSSMMDDEEVPPAITFSFSEEAERTRTSLLAERAMLLQRKDKSVVKVPRKMDDVTDCFLQAAAWVAWESNRLRIKQDIEKREEEEAADAAQSAIEELELVAKATDKSPKRKQATRKAT
jgi:cruciform cutting endonuclease 1